MNSDPKTASPTPLPPVDSKATEAPNAKRDVPVKKAPTPRRAMATAVKQLPPVGESSGVQPNTPPQRRTATKRPVSAVEKVVAPPKVAPKPVPLEVPASAESTPPVENVVVLLKPKKPEKARNSFSVTKEEDALLDVLKRRAKRLGKPTKKTDLVRAGIKVLIAISDKSFLSVLGTLTSSQEDGAPPAA